MDSIKTDATGGSANLHTYLTAPKDKDDQSCTFYHKIISGRTWLNTMLGVTNLILLAVVVSMFFHFQSELDKHTEKSQLAFEYFKERDVSEAELIHDAVTQILVAVNSATLTHQDKAFVNQAIQSITDQTHAQTAHWHQYFAGRDKLAEERRASNKRFMDRSEKTLTSLDNRLTLLEVGGG